MDKQAMHHWMERQEAADVVAGLQEETEGHHQHQ
jgi:hypothetical protein